MRLLSRVGPSPQEDFRRSSFDREALPLLREIHASAFRLVRRRSEAEDLAQDVFLQAWKAWDRFQKGTNCRAWLYKILWNVYYQGLRKKGVRPPSDGDERALDGLEARTPTPAGITDEEVAGALDRLPGIHREIVLLAYVEGFTYQEIATILGVPVGTVMSRLFRARATLRGLLGNTNGDSSSAVERGGKAVQP